MFALVEYINVFIFALKYLVQLKNNRSKSHMINCNNMVCSLRKPVRWCVENAFPLIIRQPENQGTQIYMEIVVNQVAKT